MGTVPHQTSLVAARFCIDAHRYFSNDLGMSAMPGTACQWWIVASLLSKVNDVLLLHVARTPLPTLRFSLCIKCLQELLLLQIPCRIYEFFLRAPLPSSHGLTPAVKEVEPEEKSKDSPWAGFTIICFLKWAKQFFWLMFCFVSCLTGSRMPRSPQSPLIMTSLQVGARSPTQTDSWEKSPPHTPFRIHAQTRLSPGEGTAATVLLPPVMLHLCTFGSFYRAVYLRYLVWFSTWLSDGGRTERF